MSRSTVAKHTTSTVAASLRDLADVLDLLTPATAPSQRTRTTVAPVTKSAQKAPEGSTGVVVCIGCAKPMVSNRVCRACAKKGVTADGTPPAAQKAPEGRTTVKVAAKVAPEASAKGRRDAKAHCGANGCGIFVAKGEALCTKHTLESCRVMVAPKVTKGSFITLEDGKRGYRVPADLVLALRKANLDDALIIAAAKSKGVGHKVPKAAGVLAA